MGSQAYIMPTIESALIAPLMMERMPRNFNQLLAWKMGRPTVVPVGFPGELERVGREKGLGTPSFSSFKVLPIRQAPPLGTAPEPPYDQSHHRDQEDADQDRDYDGKDGKGR